MLPPGGIPGSNVSQPFKYSTPPATQPGERTPRCNHDQYILHKDRLSVYMCVCVGGGVGNTDSKQGTISHSNYRVHRTAIGSVCMLSLPLTPSKTTKVVQLKIKLKTEVVSNG